VGVLDERIEESTFVSSVELGRRGIRLPSKVFTRVEEGIFTVHLNLLFPLGTFGAEKYGYFKQQYNNDQQILDHPDFRPAVAMSQ
jgi:hypothetical protein